MDHNFFIHLSVYGDLGCFHVLAIVNSAAMNTGIQVSFSIMVFLGSGVAGSLDRFIVGLLGHMTDLFLVFKESPYCFL